MYGGGFFVLGIVLILLARHQISQNSATAQELRDSIRSIKDSNTEISRVQALNTTLQQQLITSTQTITSLSRENLAAVTGGDSYAYVTPQTGAGVPNLPLAIHNYGKNTLTGVFITMFRGRELLAPGFSAFKYITVGTLSAHETRLLNATITPSLDGLAADGYQMQISAQNGTVRENLWFRPGKDGFPWAYLFVVDKSIELPNQKGDPAGTTRYANKVLEKREWSDDINIRNRVRQPAEK